MAAYRLSSLGSAKPKSAAGVLDGPAHRTVAPLAYAHARHRRCRGRSVATISRVLARLGLSSLKSLEPAPPVVRYEREAPGELLHMDSKKLGRIVRPGHLITEDPRDSVAGAGREFVRVAIDDHSRVSFVQMHADKRKGSAVALFKVAVAHYAALGAKINVHYLASSVDSLPFHIFLRQPITKPDLTGLRLRVIPTYRPFLESLNTQSLLNIPPGEVYTALRRNLLDGYVRPAIGLFGVGIKKQTKYRVDSGFHNGEAGVLVNLNSGRS